MTRRKHITYKIVLKHVLVSSIWLFTLKHWSLDLGVQAYVWECYHVASWEHYIPFHEQGIYGHYSPFLPVLRKETFLLWRQISRASYSDWRLGSLLRVCPRMSIGNRNITDPGPRGNADQTRQRWQNHLEEIRKAKKGFCSAAASDNLIDGTPCIFSIL